MFKGNHWLMFVYLHTWLPVMSIEHSPLIFWYFSSLHIISTYNPSTDPLFYCSLLSNVKSFHWMCTPYNFIFDKVSECNMDCPTHCHLLLPSLLVLSSTPTNDPSSSTAYKQSVINHTLLQKYKTDIVATLMFRFL
jgi:hypothetical protein